MSNTNTTKPEVGAQILLLTQPFVDSDKTFLNEVKVIGFDALHWITERKPGSKHYVPRTTIVEWAAR